ncbi:MAG: ATP-binding protein [Thermodesulfobacteriota bacterium]
MFRSLQLSLRTEIIINISLLMMAAILLIGFTMSKINERRIVHEKIESGGRMVQDFQVMIDFIALNRSEFSLTHPNVKKEIQEFVQVYTRGRGIRDLIITDQELVVVASMHSDRLNQRFSNDLLAQSIQAGQLNPQVEKSGGLLTTQYKTLVLHSPLWFRGRVVGGIRMEIPIGDVMKHLLESQKMILISIILDAIVLIIFGSFLLSRVLVTPLKELVQLTKKISEGDFSQKIEVHSKNETGQLISSFNRMIERLKEKQESLDDHLKSLESANRQLKQAQEELIRTEKLASIGRFAAGVAHEVGNPLGAILGYTSILQQGGIEREEGKDYLKRIEKEIERINRIVRELLDFARPSKFEIREVNVNKVVENALSLLSYQKNFKNIQTELNLQPDLPLIKGDESQLSQVFINIILNGIDAMEGGGTLRIQSEGYLVEDSFPGREHRLYAPRRKGDPVESDYLHLRKADPISVLLTKFSRGDRLVRVRISDTGVGIKREDLERIFDPFFTTKSPDKGTGLGLSISLRIVESMGGEIRVESEMGKGSTFELYFPAI